MNAQQLKNSILQEAIEGRLVPQDPNDEPASVLLDKIRKEKARLVMEGKLKKKDLEETPISEDEIPFEIPESWEWCKLGTIVTLIGGFAFKSHEYTSTGSRVIRISDITENGFINKNVVRYPFNDKLSQYIILEGDILMAMTGGTVGKSLYVKYLPEETMLLNQRVAIIRVNTVFTDYIDFVIKSQHIQSIITEAKNSTNDNISMGDIYNFPIPLPPLAEQKRIVAKIEELLPKVEEYGKAQEALNKLNEELPEKLKKSVLQEAIEGRLVPQDPSDEPASALLNRIREEKKRLVKEGKLKKKDLEETPISEDEKPFEIPESWEWVRLNVLLQIFTGKKDANFGDEKGEYDFFTCSNTPLKSNSYSYDGEYLIMPGNGANIGNVIHYTGKFEAYQRTYLLQSYYTINLDYLKYHLSCNWKEYNQDKLYGSAIPYIKLGNLTSYMVALPPLAEQKRIVAKIEEVFAEIDKLK